MFWYVGDLNRDKLVRFRTNAKSREGVLAAYLTLTRSYNLPEDVSLLEEDVAYFDGYAWSESDLEVLGSQKDKLDFLQRRIR